VSVYYKASAIPAAPVVKSTDQKADNTPVDEPKPYCSQFDLTKRVPSTVLDEAKTEIMQWNAVEEDNHDDYERLLNQIRKVVLDGNFSSAIPVAPGTPRNSLRVAIHSLASPSWQSKSPYVSVVCKGS
jgi:elongator complex protein 4